MARAEPRPRKIGPERAEEHRREIELVGAALLVAFEVRTATTVTIPF